MSQGLSKKSVKRITRVCHHFTHPYKFTGAVTVVRFHQIRMVVRASPVAERFAKIFETYRVCASPAAASLAHRGKFTGKCEIIKLASKLAGGLPFYVIIWILSQPMKVLETQSWAGRCQPEACVKIAANARPYTHRLQLALQPQSSAGLLEMADPGSMGLDVQTVEWSAQRDVERRSGWMRLQTAVRKTCSTTKMLWTMIAGLIVFRMKSPLLTASTV